MAGIIAAATDNGYGIAGIDYSGVKIMPITVLDSNGLGQDGDIIAGVVYAADHGANVISMSFSNPGYSPALQAAIDYAWSHNVVVVAATGNDGSNAVTYPAGDRGVMGVSNTDQNDALNSTSNYGTDTFLAAPGTDIATLAVGTDLTPDNQTTSITGTSASAAEVAAAAALLRAADPSASNGVIVSRLAESADAAGTADQTGNGRLNLARAMSDTSTTSVEPAGAAPGQSGGPLVGPYVAAATCTWNGSTANWNVSADWTGCTANGPAAGDTVVINGGAVTVNVTTPLVASVTMTAGTTTALSISSGDVLNVSGAVTVSGGSAAFSSSTLSVGAGTLNAGSLTLNGGSNTNHQAYLDISTGLATIAGNVAIGGTTGYTQIVFSGAGTLKVGGVLDVPGTFTASTGTVDFNGTSAQTIPSLNYNNLSIDNTSASGATLSAAITTTNVTGNLTVGNGSNSALLNNGGFAIAGSSGDTFAVNTGSTFSSTAGTTSAFPTGFGTVTLNATSTVNYAGAAQTVSAQTYGNLTLSGSGAKTMPGSAMTIAGNLTLSGSASATAAQAITLNGNLTIGSGTTFATGAYSHQFKGNIANSGTFTPTAGGTVTLNGGGLQTITGTTPNFAALTVNNSNGVDFSGATGNMTVSSTLTLTSGAVATGANTLIASTPTVTRTSGYVVGNLQKPVTTGTTSLTFDVGTGANYTPIALTSMTVSAATGASLTATTTASEHPQIATSSLDPSKDANRYWSLTPAGTLTVTTYVATVTFVSGDIDAGASPTTFVMRKYNSSWASPSSQGSATSTTNAATFSSTPGFGGFVVGNTDTTGPTLTITAPTAFAAQSATSYNVTFTATDAGSGVNTSTLSLQRQRAAVVTAGSCPTSGYTNDGSPVTPATSPVSSTGLADGYCYQWILTGSDNAGNAGTAATSAQILVDTTAPTVAFTAPSGAVVQSSTTYNVTWTESDAGSGVASRSIQRQSGAPVANACTGTTWANDGAATTTASPRNDTGLVTNTCYRWQASVTDNVGNVGTATSGTVLVDTTAPTVAFTAPSGAVVQSSTTYNVTWTESDAGSGVASRSIQRQSGAPVANACTGTTWANDGAATTTASPRNDTGLVTNTCYRWQASVTDNVGNVGTATSGTVLVDTTAPTVAFTAPSGAVVQSSTTYNVTWTESDAGSGVASRSIQRQSGAPVANACTGTTWANDGAATTTASPRNDTGLVTNTCYRWQASVTDNVGNVGTATSGTVLVDTTAPASGVTLPANGGSYGSSTWTGSLTGTASDAGSGVASVAYSVQQGSGNYWNGSSFGSGTEQKFAASGTTSWTAAFALGNFPTDGTYTVRVYATDAAGNVQTTAGSSTFTIDKTAPVVSSVTLLNTSPNNTGSVQYTVTFTKPVSGVTTSIFGLTPGTGNTLSGTSVSNVAGSGTTWTVTVNTGTGDGTLRLDQTSSGGVVDGVGNPLAGTFTAGGVYTIDRTGPNAPSISGHPANPTNSTSATFTFGSTDPTAGGVSSGVAGYQCKLDSGSFGPCSSGVSYSGLLEGSHTFTVYAIDFATNTSSNSTYTWSIDTTAPSSAITFPVDGASYNNATFDSGCSGTICGTAADSGSGVASVDVVLQQVDGSNYFNPVSGLFDSASAIFVPATLDGSNWSLAFPATTFPAEGQYVVVSRATDLAGNAEWNALAFTVSFGIDRTAPIVSLVSPANGSSTNDTTPALGGTAGILAGDQATVTVKIYSGSDTSALWSRP